MTKKSENRPKTLKTQTQDYYNQHDRNTSKSVKNYNKKKTKTIKSSVLKENLDEEKDKHGKR